MEQPTGATTQTSTVAIVTPIYKPEMSPDDELALNQLDHHLAGHDRYFFAPEGLAPQRSGFRMVHFSEPYFRSVASYSQLLLSTEFYRAFQDYEYILIYQLDCLVFSDALLDWCRAGWDYIGAPWLADPENPRKGFSRVGNGGLSLRRVDSFLSVLEARKEARSWVSSALDIARTPLPELTGRSPFPRFLKRIRLLRDIQRGALAYLPHYTLNEDRFWSDRARLFWPDFQVAPIHEGLRFAFECAPRYCFEENHQRLPFGCHAWKRWDPEFWRPFTLR